MTGSTWMLKEAMAYLAYGAIKQLKNAPETGRKKFTGKEFDEEGGDWVELFWGEVFGCGGGGVDGGGSGGAVFLAIFLRL